MSIALALASAQAESLPPSSLEETVCGALAERWAFQNWSAAAGSPDDSLVAEVGGAVLEEFTTLDKRKLVGFRLRAQSRPIGSLLFVQGNGILVDRALRWLTPFTEAGFDVYLYDFRGYGRSNGNRRLKAMVSDYRSLVGHLAKNATQPLHAYAVSFGGVLLMNSISALPPSGRAVIDATPSIVSMAGCPNSYDPVRHIPSSAERLLVIVGSRDNVLGPAFTDTLRKAVVAARGQELILDGHGHPFTGTRDDHFKRLAHVVEFLKKH